MFPSKNTIGEKKDSKSNLVLVQQVCHVTQVKSETRYIRLPGKFTQKHNIIFLVAGTACLHV